MHAVRGGLFLALVGGGADALKSDFGPKLASSTRAEVMKKAQKADLRGKMHTAWKPLIKWNGEDPLTCEDMGWLPATRQRRVVDAFVYNGERKMVEARMMELAGVVDDTVAVTSTVSYHGQKVANPPVPPSPDGVSFHHLVLPESDFDVCVDFAAKNRTNQKDHWSFIYKVLPKKAEKRCYASVAKNSVAKGVEKLGYASDEWVLFSDPDEIPNREVVRLLKECELPMRRNVAALSAHAKDPGFHHVRFAGRHYAFTTKCEVPHSFWTKDCEVGCHGVNAITVGGMRKTGLQGMREFALPYCAEAGPHADCSTLHPAIVLPNSMWHLSTFRGGDVAMPPRKPHVKTGHEPGPTHLALHQLWKCRGGFNDTKSSLQEISTHLGQNLEVKALKEPAMTYPHVPHSVAEDPEHFKEFFEWGDAGEEPIGDDDDTEVLMGHLREGIKKKGIGTEDDPEPEDLAAEVDITKL